MEPQQTPPLEPTPQPKFDFHSPQLRKWLLLGAGLVTAIVVALLVFHQSDRGGGLPTISGPVDYGEARRQSTSGENPELLQEFLVDKIEAGENDAETRSAIYWITHRYFDNGGNIYEIYDFVENNPSVHFLKEAEGIYPTVFEAVKARTVTNYSRESLLALLAYYEVIDQYGYASIAIWGLAANKYSEQAQMNLPNPTDSAELATERARYFEMTARKAQAFIDRTENFIINNTNTTGTLDDLRQTDIDVNDLLVGLNQHASAIANLSGFGRLSRTVYSVPEIFEYTSQLAMTDVQRLYFFTNYLYATALVQSGTANDTNVAVPLDRVVEYARANTDWRDGGSIERVVNSKDSGEASLFAYDITKKLAALHPPFKTFLEDNGWQASDF